MREAGVEHARRHGGLQAVVGTLEPEAQVPHAGSHEVRVCSLGPGLHGQDEPGQRQAHPRGQLLGLPVVQQPYPAPCSTPGISLEYRVPQTLLVDGWALVWQVPHPAPCDMSITLGPQSVR